MCCMYISNLKYILFMLCYVVLKVLIWMMLLKNVVNSVINK